MIPRRNGFRNFTAACLIFSAALLLSYPSPASASRFFPEMTGKLQFAVETDVLKLYGATATEKKLFAGKLQRIAEVVHKSAPLAPPKGIDVKARGLAIRPGSRCEQKACTSARIMSEIEILLAHFVDSGSGKPVKTHAPTALTIYTNFPNSTLFHNSLSFEGLKDEKGNPIFKQPKQIGTLGGFPFYSNRVLVISNGSKPHWVPVSREVYLRAIINDASQRVKAGASEYKMVEDRIREELNIISPDHRATQAYVGGGVQISGLADEGEEGAVPLIMFNPDFFDPLLPRTAIQLITVEWNPGFPYFYEGSYEADENENLGAVRVFQLFNAIDYQNLAAELDGPRRK